MPVMDQSGAPAQNDLTRRKFYVAMIYGLWSLIAAALSVPAAIYLLIPPKLRKMPQWVAAGDVSSLDPRAPMEMVFRQNRVDGWKIQSEKTSAWVVKLADSEVVAYGPQCTHLGCAYHWDDNATLSVPLPLLHLQYRWHRDLGSRAAAARPLRDQGGEGQAAAGALRIIRRDKIMKEKAR
jgi:Rieske Fe-S protein